MAAAISQRCRPRTTSTGTPHGVKPASRPQTRTVTTGAKTRPPNPDRHTVGLQPPYGWAHPDEGRVPGHRSSTRTFSGGGPHEQPRQPHDAGDDQGPEDRARDEDAYGSCVQTVVMSHGIVAEGLTQRPGRILRSLLEPGHAASKTSRGSRPAVRGGDRTGAGRPAVRRAGRVRRPLTYPAAAEGQASPGRASCTGWRRIVLRLPGAVRRGSLR